MDTAFEQGWSNSRNGDLLDRAEKDSYQLLITTDQYPRCQQNLTGRRLGILVLLSTSSPRIQRRVDDIRAAAGGMGPGESRDIPI